MLKDPVALLILPCRRIGSLPAATPGAKVGVILISPRPHCRRYPITPWVWLGRMPAKMLTSAEISTLSAYIRTLDSAQPSGGATPPPR